MAADIFSDINIIEAYALFGQSSNNVIHVECTTKFKELVESLAKSEDLSMRNYLVKLVMNDYEIKYKDVLARLKTLEDYRNTTGEK